MSDIPQEIIREILKRLPVKSLLRFRCVSKPWRSLIDSSDFIKLHLHSFGKTNSNLRLVVEGSELFYFDLDTFKNLGTGNTRFDPLLVVPSCNGLVLVVSKCKDLLLWNPATRKLNKLPTTPLDYEKSSRVHYVMESYALGYDSKHDDYKVVRVLRAGDADGGVVSSQAKVYSLKSKSWKMIEAFQYALPPEGWGVYLNDALHTVVGHNYNCLEAIMAFDLVKEKHFEVPKPGFSGAKRGFASVEVMGGFLTLVVPGMMNNSEIWVMKEYGVKESWTKLLCFEPLLPMPCTYLRPLASSKRGDEVLFNYERIGLCWYHLRKETASFVRDRDLMKCFGADPSDPTFNALVCMQSLVSPHSPGSGVGTEKQKQGKKGKVIKMKRDDFLSAGFKLKL